MVRRIPMVELVQHIYSMQATKTSFETIFQWAIWITPTNYLSFTNVLFILHLRL